MKMCCAYPVRNEGGTIWNCGAEIVKDDGTLYHCAKGHSSNEVVVLAPQAAYRGYGKRKGEA